MRYYSGTIKRNQIESLNAWQEQLEQQQKVIVLVRGYDKDKYYITLQAEQKPSTGSFYWLKHNKQVKDIDAIWYKPGSNESPVGTVWIVQYNENNYVIEYQLYGNNNMIKEFKTLPDAVSYLITEGYIKMYRKQWLAKESITA